MSVIQERQKHLPSTLHEPSSTLAFVGTVSHGDFHCLRPSAAPSVFVACREDTKKSASLGLHIPQSQPIYYCAGKATLGAPQRRTLLDSVQTQAVSGNAMCPAQE